MSWKLITWWALRAIPFVLSGCMIMACAASTPPVISQQPQNIQTEPVLETCAVVRDEDLAEMRGCYDTYSFGMNITGNFDLASKNFSIQTNYTQAVEASQKMPSQVMISPGGNHVAFSNGNVAYTAGIGQNSLGTGIMQVIQVAGQNIAVNANMSVTLNINNIMQIKAPTAGNTLPGTLSSIIK